MIGWETFANLDLICVRLVGYALYQHLYSTDKYRCDVFVLKPGEAQAGIGFLNGAFPYEMTKDKPLHAETATPQKDTLPGLRFVPKAVNVPPPPPQQRPQQQPQPKSPLLRPQPPKT